LRLESEPDLATREGDEVEVSVSSQGRDGVLTVAVSGEIDLATGPDVERAIAVAIGSDGVSEVRVDLSGVEFLDSSGVALLLKGRRGADERGIGFRVSGARGITLQVLELTGVWAYLTGESLPDRPAAR
jgi:anti-anti-sigma factor